MNCAASRYDGVAANANTATQIQPPFLEGFDLAASGSRNGEILPVFDPRQAAQLNPVFNGLNLDWLSGDTAAPFPIQEYSQLTQPTSFQGNLQTIDSAGLSAEDKSKKNAH